MVRVCGDPHSLGFYRRIALSVPEHRIFEALSQVRTASLERRIAASKAALFTSLIMSESRATK